MTLIDISCTVSQLVHGFFVQLCGYGFHKWMSWSVWNVWATFQPWKLVIFIFFSHDALMRNRKK